MSRKFPISDPSLRDRVSKSHTVRLVMKAFASMSVEELHKLLHRFCFPTKRPNSHPPSVGLLHRTLHRSIVYRVSKLFSARPMSLQSKQALQHYVSVLKDEEVFRLCERSV